ncbi:probable LRR receptor-like serine/threonine-protein kinase isoform X1 [Tanacetum coccineum]
MRLRVALDSANPPVFHRDIKTSNILIDSKLTSKVVFHHYWSRPNYVSTVVRGSPVSLFPSYFLSEEPWCMDRPCHWIIISSDLWQNKSFSATARHVLDFRNNSFSHVKGNLNPPVNASLRIGYRLKSPSFSYNQPYHDEFEEYVTSSLNLEFYQLSMDSIMWEKGPRLRMHLKLFPKAGTEHSNTFSRNEVLRIRGIYTTWVFRRSDLFGPYELLNFTLVRPYANMIIDTPRKGISKAVLVTVVAVAVAFAKFSINIDGVKSFSFQEMTLATQNFSSSSVVGRGGYGKVYKGILWDGTVVAIKLAEEGSLQGEKEFLAEIELLSRLHHRNLVSLVGYCGEEQEKMLVYEFISRGTLRDRLTAKSGESLSFRMRLNVALDSAKGILYLHTEANPPIFHRDIKTSNIFTTPNSLPKLLILDSHGLHHFWMTMESVLTTYPPLLEEPPLGVVLLEILTSMKPLSHGKNIVREFVSLALWCCNDKPEKRPSMLDVVRELEHILEKMPETGPGFSEPESRLFVESSSTSLFYSSSNVQGSDLSSGGNPIVYPR